MEANGHVQSQVYNARRQAEAGGAVPVSATADSMTYSDPNRTLHYEGNVDIRQGTDRLTSGVADVYLYKESSEVEKTIAQRDGYLLSRIGKALATGPSIRVPMRWPF